MIPDILKYFNWVDVVVFIFLIRGIYEGAKNGLVIELFSLCGWSIAIFLSFKFYKSVAQILHQRTEIPLIVDELLTFVTIIVAVIILANIAGGMLKSIIKIKIIDKMSRFSGALLGLIKAAVVLGIIFYAVGIAAIPYLDKSVKERSLSGKAISKVADVLYSNIEHFIN